MFDESRVIKSLMTGNTLYGEIFTEETAYTLIQIESEKIEKLEKGTRQRGRTPAHTSLADILCIHQFH